MTRIEWLIGAAMLAGALLLTHLAFGHDFYEGLSNPRGQRCCGGTDCRAVLPGQVRNVEGQLQILDTGEWLLVPDEAWLDTPTPDGAAHYCRLLGEDYIRCYIPAHGG